MTDRGAGQGVAGARDLARSLPESEIRAVAHLGMGRPDVIGLWFGEPDVPTPGFVREAGAAALAAGDTFYQPNRGLSELRAALAGYVSGLYGAEVQEERITVTASGLNGLLLSLQVLLDAGDRVVTVAPVWNNLEAMPRLAGAEVETVPLRLSEGRWRLDLDRLFDACGDRTRLLILNSPANPNGWTLSADEQAAILGFARGRGTWILADEVYARIAYDRPVAPSFLSLAEEEDRVVVVNSFSKTWAMTGWRLGWLTAPRSLGPVLGKVMEFNISCAPGFTQRAGIAAVRDGEDFVREQVTRYAAMRDLVVARLGGLPRVTLPVPPATFYAFFAVAGVEDSAAFARRLLDEAGVGLAPGTAFGPAGEGWLRLCFAASRERLEAACERLAPWLE